MNWELVKWVAGTLLTVAGIKFVWTAFRTLFSKDNFEDLLDSAGDACGRSAQRTANYMKSKVEERRMKKAKEKEKNNNLPKVYIR